MFDVIALDKLLEFMTAVRWTIVTDKFVRNSMCGEVSLYGLNNFTGGLVL